ncbi:MAG: hypothetical protein JEZ10_07150 [Verrucomicrobia bacterium]|nr:hypothetical protein [Verrucomicrobiota bacterium]
MLNLFTDYPSVPWKQGWRFSSGPDDANPLITGPLPGSMIQPQAAWTLQLLPESDACFARFFSNGISVCTRRRAEKNRIDVLLLHPGVLTGRVIDLPLPVLSAPDGLITEPGLAWIETGHHTTLLLTGEQRFALVSGEFSREQALRKAEDALDEDFELLAQNETARRQTVSSLFGINPRHNPPVALAAESLIRRLRSRTASIHGIWSTADGFEDETFSLNELYALVHAWVMIDPATALELTQTALSLQQGGGGFPAWINVHGMVSAAAPWPLIIQSFELAWESGGRDPLVLKQTLPALRKYIQWALRQFDPYRDGIPAWQSDQEVFVPESFERNKATPELTVMLLEEIDSLLRLCATSDHSETAVESLAEQRDHLAETLTSIFWNPEKKAFSNVWKNGHFIDEPSFGSFLPLLWKNLESDYQTPLLEQFEETHGFPGHKEPVSWKKEEIDDTAHLPAIHQFMAFEALRHADSSRALLLLFVRRAREGFAAWFERESIEAARLVSHGETTEAPAFELGPITASLILTTQYEFQRAAQKNAPVFRQLLSWVHRLRFRSTDLRILIVFGIAIVIVHLAYNLPRIQDADTRIAEAAMNYQQGRLREALAICRRYPDHALSRLLQANLLMLTENPLQAEELYHQALRQETASPSALLGYALALQLNGKCEDAVRRYNDFLDLYEDQFSLSTQKELIDLAYEFLRLAEEKFSKPPKWKRIYAYPVMNDLGL